MVAKQNGSTGPHPNVGSLPSYALIIRAETMQGSAVKQALDEMDARGLWLIGGPEGRKRAEERALLPEPDSLVSLPVIFRAERTKDGDVTAVFPTLPHDAQGNFFTVYAHVGQHGGGSWGWYDKTRRARSHEYGDLLAELNGIYGRKLDDEDTAYKLVVYQRVTPQHRKAFRAEVDRLRETGNR